MVKHDGNRNIGAPRLYQMFLCDALGTVRLYLAACKEWLPLCACVCFAVYLSASCIQTDGICHNKAFPPLKATVFSVLGGVDLFLDQDLQTQIHPLKNMQVTSAVLDLLCTAVSSRGMFGKSCSNLSSLPPCRDSPSRQMVMFWPPWLPITSTKGALIQPPHASLDVSSH